jgi:hypothetical protein
MKKSSSAYLTMLFMKVPHAQFSQTTARWSNMATHHAMLSRDFSRGLILFNGKYLHVEELAATARALQHKALSYKASGDRARAVALYRELIPYLDKLDDLEVSVLPRGLQSQVARRTIEQLEEQATSSA